MSDKYILEGKEPIPCPDIHKWAMWYEKADRRVNKTTIGDVDVSTVFLGLNHGFWDNEILLFETMIFGGEHDGDTFRCATWEEAEKQHDEAVAMLFNLTHAKK